MSHRDFTVSTWFHYSDFTICLVVISLSDRLLPHCDFTTAHTFENFSKIARDLYIYMYIYTSQKYVAASLWFHYRTYFREVRPPIQTQRSQEPSLARWPQRFVFRVQKLECMSEFTMRHIWQRDVQKYRMYVLVYYWDTFDCTMAAALFVQQHTATHCNTLQHIEPCLPPRWLQRSVCLEAATHCVALHHTATHCNILRHTVTHGNTLQQVYLRDGCSALCVWRLQHTASHCITWQHTATYCDTLSHTATHCSKSTCAMAAALFVLRRLGLGRKKYISKVSSTVKKIYTSTL